MSRMLEVENVKLEMRRVLPAPQDRVFAAWTDPATMNRWFAPGDMKATVEADVRVGGGYRIAMREPSGGTHVTYGIYREIVPHRRLVFTWGWEGPDRHESLVTVELHPRGDETELHLVHERLASEESRRQHTEGWTGCLDNFERYIRS